MTGEEGMRATVSSRTLAVDSSYGSKMLSKQDLLTDEISVADARRGGHERAQACGDGVLITICCLALSLTGGSLLVGDIVGVLMTAS